MVQQNVGPVDVLCLQMAIQLGHNQQGIPIKANVTGEVERSSRGNKNKWGPWFLSLHISEGIICL